MVTQGLFYRGHKKKEQIYCGILTFSTKNTDLKRTNLYKNMSLKTIVNYEFVPWGFHQRTEKKNSETKNESNWSLQLQYEGDFELLNPKLGGWNVILKGTVCGVTCTRQSNRENSITFEYFNSK